MVITIKIAWGSKFSVWEISLLTESLLIKAMISSVSDSYVKMWPDDT
ncbi:hypothetical protein DespoDRAFT_00952 [Desulfobacter postgatei 2ac9]|jgi:hypothetical protein|uniref:Uncharacterized protein n=1 Tax=Desulfobacter postgatei 2ac9 TaxID=879212 RepID=I5B0B6_9BACT|nr:hypothetical protein DespoDRAFT_00952 [Desulfobacter postgatei 2ac9]